MLQAEIYSKILGILSKQLSVPAEKIELEALIASDLGADSLDTAEIAMMVKDEFNYDFTDQEMSQIKTVQDIIDILDKNLTKKI